jgi:hypothetical protein
MILDKKIAVKVIGKTFKYYKELNYNINKKNTIILVNVEDLSKGSNIKINVKCDFCGNEKLLNYSKYIKNTKNFTELYGCCELCSKEKREKTNEKNSGFKYPAQNPKTLKKMAGTNIEKYGSSCPMNSEKIKKKIKEENKKNFGFEYPAQNKNIFSKVEETNLKKYGNKCSLANEEIKKKAKNKILKKFGVDNVLKNKKIREKAKKTRLEIYRNENYNNREKAKKTNLERYGVEHPMQIKEIFNKQQKSSSAVKKYKDTELVYQGAYEKFFLEEMEKIGFLNKIKNGKKYNYILKNKIHIYYSDFEFNNITIEIKSNWTYNKNGKDKDLELENETKWKSVVEFGDKIIVLKSKKEIKDYIISVEANR